MRIHSAVALVVLAISFALPGFAQEQTAVDPEVRQQVETVAIQLVEALNKHDAATAAALYTQDAVRLEDWNGGGLHVGREDIEKEFAELSASNWPPTFRKLVQMYSIEDRIATISEWSSRGYDGHSVKIYVRDADTWRIRMEFVTVEHSHQ
jgi:ketosteroid isomerase-like protein